MNWVKTYIDDYYLWLKERTFVQEDNHSGWSVISTPFLGAFNDHIEIYAKREADKLLLSDNGETLSNLELQGVQFRGSGKRRLLLDQILRNYGIHENGDEFVLEASFDRFSQAKHNFISAILEINDLYVLAKHQVVSLFKEDVREYLDGMQDLIFTPDFISKGVTGLEFTFDFQRAAKKQEIVIKSFNTLQKSSLQTFLFSWDDIKPIREKATKKDVRAIAIINDQQAPKKDYLYALKAREADYILWSERHSQKARELLGATA